MLIACPNCCSDLAGEYCQSCGQKRIEVDDLSARRFCRELVDEIAKLQFGRKAIVTVLALFSPGRLTNEFLAGRRGTYLGPIKVYLLCAAIFFVAAPFVGFDLDSLLASDPGGKLAAAVSAAAQDRGVDPATFADRFLVRLQSIYTLALTFTIVLWALLLALLYRSRHLPFGVHLTFAVHYTSLLYLLTLATNGVAHWLSLAIWLQFVALYAILAPYLFLALERVYPASRASTLWRWAILLPMKIFVFDLVDAAAVRLTLRLV